MRLKIEKAVTDAMGLAHDGDGKVVLVSGALPGETVECALSDSGKGVSRAEVIDVLEPSPLRIAPYCPYYSVCGGCSFQIVNERDSAAIKEDIVKDNLLRIGKLDHLPPFEPAVYGSASKYHSVFLPVQRKAARKAPQKPPALPWEGESRFLKDFLFSPAFQEEGQRKGKGPGAEEDRSEEISLCSLLPA